MHICDVWCNVKCYFRIEKKKKKNLMCQMLGGFFFFKQTRVFKPIRVFDYSLRYIQSSFHTHQVITGRNPIGVASRYWQDVSNPRLHRP